MNSGFSIIIPTLNEELWLPDTLDSIAKQDFAGNVQVVVIDAQSTDRTRDVALSFQDRLSDLTILKTSSGLSRQRNLGVVQAKYEHLVFLDADSVLPPRFLTLLAHRLSNSTDVVALPLILPHKGSILDYCFAFLAYLFFMSVRFTGPIVTGMCLISSRTLHQKIGGFTDKAVYGEDIEYGLRARKQGAKYHLYLGCLLYSSPRRREKTSRREIGIMWLRMYFETLHSGPITDKKSYDYDYEKHLAK